MTIDLTDNSVINDVELKEAQIRVIAGYDTATGEMKEIGVDSSGNSTTSVTFQDNATTDAFGRLRTSEPVTLFDSKQTFDNLPLLYDDQEVSGSGTTSTWSQDTASSVMGVAETTAGKRVRQSFMWFNYQPGKSHQIITTGVLRKSGGGTGIKSAMGYFNDENGVFVLDNEGTPTMVLRSYVTGSAVDTEVAQSSWNIDTMDGTGDSGITIDFTKSQIFFTDLEWLGVGAVRVGFVIDRKIYYVHQFNHANTISGVYMSTANLPVRYEIENDGTGAASTFEVICSSVASEGGEQRNGILQSNSTGAITSLGNNASYAVMGGRLKTTCFGASVIVENMSVIGSANDQAEWAFYVGGSVAGTFTFSNKTNSCVQIAEGTASNTFTGGTRIDGGYFTTEQGIQFTLPNATRLGSSIDGTPQEWYLVVTPITNNITVRASVTWRELL